MKFQGCCTSISISINKKRRSHPSLQHFRVGGHSYRDNFNALRTANYPIWSSIWEAKFWWCLEHNNNCNWSADYGILLLPSNVKLKLSSLQDFKFSTWFVLTDPFCVFHFIWYFQASFPSLGNETVRLVLNYCPMQCIYFNGASHVTDKVSWIERCCGGG